MSYWHTSLYQWKSLTSRSPSQSSRQRWCELRCPGRTCSPVVTTSHRWLHGWYAPGPGWASTRHPSESTHRRYGQRHTSQCGWTLGPNQCLREKTEMCKLWIKFVYISYFLTKLSFFFFTVGWYELMYLWFVHCAQSTHGSWPILCLSSHRCSPHCCWDSLQSL